MIEIDAAGGRSTASRIVGGNSAGGGPGGAPGSSGRVDEPGSGLGSGLGAGLDSALGTGRGVGRGRINLRTLGLIRWIGLSGQALTLVFVALVLGYPLPLLLALAIVGVSAALNLVTILGGIRRLDERAATIYLGYDLVQLGALLYLTGGLQNPFSVLLLAPVTVAASMLSWRRIASLSIAAIAIASLLAIRHLPLPWAGGAPAQLPLSLTGGTPDLPPLYLGAIWLSLTISTIFISAFIWNVTEDGRRLDDAFSATQLALAREQRVSAVSALAAAAAHELGSPLGTIAVVAKELVRDLPPGSPYAEDAQLLLSETARCRTILAGLARRREADGGSPFEMLPISALVEAAGEAHAAEQHPAGAKAVEIVYHVEGDPAGEPVIARHPEIIHGIGNLVQNAIQFAATQVEVTTAWDKRHISVEVADDGPGFMPQILSRLGQPYMSSRSDDGDHMGLGVFIAETLLRRTGGETTYENTPDSGALVRVTWPRSVLDGGRGAKP